jgi:hypothetical protein
MRARASCSSAAVIMGWLGSRSSLPVDNFRAGDGTRCYLPFLAAWAPFPFFLIGEAVLIRSEGHLALASRQREAGP